MPRPLNVDWPAVRVLAVAVGVREPARQMGISQDAVRQRSKRERWMASPKTVAQRALAKPVTKCSVTSRCARKCASGARTRDQTVISEKRQANGERR